MLVLERPVRKYSFENTSYSLITSFYANTKNRDTVCLFYDEGSNLKTLISFDDFYKWNKPEEYDYYIQNSNNNHIGYEFEQADNVFKRFPMWKCIISKLEFDTGTFICKTTTTTTMTITVNYIYSMLSKHGVNVFRINIPNPSDIIDENRADNICKNGLSNYLNLIQTHDVNPPDFIHKITDVSPEELHSSLLLQGKTIGKGKKTIFLVGPCIVGGWENPDGEKLGEILLHKIENVGIKYQIHCVSMNMDDTSNVKEMLQNDVKKNDIVLIFMHSLSSYEIDTTDLYNDYHGDKFLYTDHPIHSTVTANKLIADWLIKKIILPIEASSNEYEDSIVQYHGKIQFTPATEKEIVDYAENVVKIRDIPACSKIGAIVMNCNPFTLGHRYLVEYASDRVDYLYIFVVEEDLSAIPFVDRLFMVHEGTKDIQNVIVVPSGKYIISKDTFFNYFDKENDVHNAGAEEDVEIFSRFIAKKLNISKRFVGEEPYDLVTSSYNAIMKSILPEYGIELVEIPRKYYGEENHAINATDVRKALEVGDIETIKKSVPLFVEDYLKRNRNTVLHRIKRLMEKNKTKDSESVQEDIAELIKKIQSYEKVVFYSIGQDTQGIVDLLPTDCQERLEFCDIRANDGAVYFRDKQVYRPDELQTTLKDYQIIVGAISYGEEIYEDFLKRGIPSSRYIFNRISFNKEVL